MKEQYKPIKDFPGYQVSDGGNVKGLKGWILKPVQDKKGYLKIGLYSGDGYYMRLVSRLVAQAFIPNPDSLLQVNHINEVKSDNRAVNLEWVTHAENQRHSAKLDWVQVRVIRELQGVKIVVIAAYFMVSQSYISNIRANRKWLK